MSFSAQATKFQYMNQMENYFHPLWNINVLLRYSLNVFTVVVACSFELNVNTEKL